MLDFLDRRYAAPYVQVCQRAALGWGAERVEAGLSALLQRTTPLLVAVQCSGGELQLADCLACGASPPRPCRWARAAPLACGARRWRPPSSTRSTPTSPRCAVSARFDFIVRLAPAPPAPGREQLAGSGAGAGLPHNGQAVGQPPAACQHRRGLLAASPSRPAPPQVYARYLVPLRPYVFTSHRARALVAARHPADAGTLPFSWEAFDWPAYVQGHWARGLCGHNAEHFEFTRAGFLTRRQRLALAAASAGWGLRYAAGTPLRAALACARPPAVVDAPAYAYAAKLDAAQRMVVEEEEDGEDEEGSVSLPPSEAAAVVGVY